MAAADHCAPLSLSWTAGERKEDAYDELAGMLQYRSEHKYEEAAPSVFGRGAEDASDDEYDDDYWMDPETSGSDVEVDSDTEMMDTAAGGADDDDDRIPLAWLDTRMFR